MNIEKVNTTPDRCICCGAEMQVEHNMDEDGLVDSIDLHCNNRACFLFKLYFEDTQWDAINLKITEATAQLQKELEEYKVDYQLQVDFVKRLHREVGDLKSQLATAHLKINELHACALSLQNQLTTARADGMRGAAGIVGKLKQAMPLSETLGTLIVCHQAIIEAMPQPQEKGCEWKWDEDRQCYVTPHGEDFHLRDECELHPYCHTCGKPIKEDKQ